MTTTKRLRAPLVVMFGVLTAVVTFAGPASADTAVYPPPAGTQVLGSSASSNVKAAGTTEATEATEAATSGLAFTGTNALGVGALGGLLLVGGATMVLVGKRRKVND
jgi:hypothetical protein